MDILDKYPQARQEFASWFMDKYNMTLYSFDEAPFEHQCIALSRCFGYRIDLESWPITMLEDHVNNILYLYEEVVKKYPDGVPDVIGKMQKIGSNHRTDEFEYLDKPADISHGLNEAITDLLKPVPGKHHMKSLHDALIELKVERTATVDEDYWTSDKITKTNEKAPF